MSLIIYNLPCGRIVYLTVEQLLNLTDEDIRYMDSNNIGSHCSNPFIKLPYDEKEKFIPEEEDLKDLKDQDIIDYDPSDDNTDLPDEPINFDRMFDD